MDIFGVDIRDIMLILLTLLIIFLFYKTRKIEYFADPPLSEMVATAVTKAVNDTYLVDISAMRNLANISQDIMTNKDSLKLPTNINIPGNLTVDGNIFLTNKNTNLLDLLPKFIVVAWASPDGVPKGWALCDGRKYKMNPTTGVVTLLNMDSIEDNTVITPDLRGRFILGAGQGDGLTNRDFNKSGGEENHTLTIAELPQHRHHVFYDGPFANSNDNRVAEIVEYGNKINAVIKAPMVGPVGRTSGTMAHLKNSSDSGNYTMQSSWGNEPNVGKTSQQMSDGDSIPIDANKSHNNMPPFYTLYYIMKL